MDNTYDTAAGDFVARISSRSRRCLALAQLWSLLFPCPPQSTSAAPALDRWMANRSGPSRNNLGPDRRTVPDRPADALELAAARATIAQFEARLEDRAALVRAAEDRAQAAELDRDRWCALAETLEARPSDPPRAPPSDPAHGPTPRRWWPWRRG